MNTGIIIGIPSIPMSSFNDRPRLIANAEISVQEGGEVVITSAMLQVSDDSLASDMVYRVLALPEEGLLKLNGSPLTLGSTFTQADINHNRLTYLHNSSDTVRDRFRFSASENSGRLITRVSVKSDGSQGNWGSSGRYTNQISANGRYVLFGSSASDLVDGNSSIWSNLFVHDRLTGITSLVSGGANGLRANGEAGRGAISADGRFVAFESAASNLVNGDTNGSKDIFVHDRQTGQTSRVSISTAGIQGNTNSEAPAISADGRFVAFTSTSSNLVSGDTNNFSDVFVHDRATGRTERVSIGASGAQANSESHIASISADGRFVVFSSWATNLVGGDTNGRADLFVHDRQTGQTTNISIGFPNAVASADGRYVLFWTGSGSLIYSSGDLNADLFVHDRQTGQTALVSISAANIPDNSDWYRLQLSADGRYITFVATARNSLGGDDPRRSTIFVHDRQTERTLLVSTTETGEFSRSATSYFSAPLTSMSADGRYFAFSSPSDDLVRGDTNRLNDTFVYDAGAVVGDLSIVIQPVSDGATIVPSTAPLSYFEPAAASTVDGRLRITSGDTATLVSATIAIENYAGPGQEQLNFADQNGIQGQFDAAAGILTLTGVASLTAYQTALRSISYSNRSNHPAPVRTIRFQVNDGVINSPIATRRIEIDQPALSLARIAAAAETVTVTREMLQITDSNSALEQLVYTLTGLPTSGTLQLNGQTLAIHDTFTQADIDSGRLTYFSQTIPSTDRFDFTFSDGNAVSRISVDAGGNQTRGDVHPLVELPVPGLSADGRLIVYASGANDLVEGDTNQSRDIFVFDRETQQTTRVSIASNGTQSNGLSDSPSISADGRFVAFWSEASNLVENDTNGVADTFVHDRLTGITERISVDAAGTEGNGDSWGTAISADGRFVIYSSAASNLVSGDTNSQRDVFVFDRTTRQTTRVSIDSSGTQSNGLSRYPWISGNGRYIAFHSNGSNLVSGDTNGTFDVFVHDRQTGQTSAVSINSQGRLGNRESLDPMLSHDGRFVVFESAATNLVSDPTNFRFHIFLHDRQTGETICISRNAAGVLGNGDSLDPTISADGRYITFASNANNLVAGDTNHQTDVFQYDRQTNRLIRLSQNGLQANGSSFTPMIAPDGQSILFYSLASNLGGNDTNDRLDLFVSSARRISGSATIAIRSNQAPVLSRAISDQTAIEATPFQLTIPTDTFIDSDPGDRLVYSATLANGDLLPSWLSFDSSSGTFRGIPAQAGRLTLRVTATDSAGVAVSDEFELALVARRSDPGTDTGNDFPGAGSGSSTSPGSGSANHAGSSSANYPGSSSGNGNSGIPETGNDNRQDDRPPLQPLPQFLVGTPGADRIEGGDAGDSLLGMAGNDFLLGRGGSDQLVGGAGRDTLEGGAGADRFIYRAGRAAGQWRDSTLNNLDRIIDFNPKEGDRIQLDFDGNRDSSEQPSSLFSVNSWQSSLRQALYSAFEDKNQRQRGNQRLRANEAVLLTWRGRTFLAVNDSQIRSRSSLATNFSPRHDFAIELARTDSIAAGVLNAKTFFV